MSRPPHLQDQAPIRKGIIDFVGAPAYYPGFDEPAYYPQQTVGSCHPGLYNPMPLQQQQQPMPYATMMQGYPGPVGSLYPGQEYVNSAGYYPPMPYTSSPYYTPPIPQPEPPSLSSSKPSISEEEIKERINSKIESIMEAQKTEMLSNQIEKLTDRVQKLSRNIEYSHSSPPSSGLSSGYSPDEARAPANLSSYENAGGDDDDISHRLKQLASESMKRTQTRSSGRKIPNW